MIEVRAATAQDANAMSAILRPILASWNSARPHAPDHVLAHYIADPDGILCSVAEGPSGQVIGFQSLKIASESNPFDLPVGFGVIGTYVDTAAAGQGVGRALFAASLRAAKTAGLAQIDATIGTGNASGLAYYEAMGFRTYRTLPGAVGKVFNVI